MFPGRCAGKHFRDSLGLKMSDEGEKLRRSTRKKEKIDYKQMANGKKQQINTDKEENEDDFDLTQQGRQVVAREDQWKQMMTVIR